MFKPGALHGVCQFHILNFNSSLRWRVLNRRGSAFSCHDIDSPRMGRLSGDRRHDQGPDMRGSVLLV